MVQYRYVSAKGKNSRSMNREVNGKNDYILTSLQSYAMREIITRIEMVGVDSIVAWSKKGLLHSIVYAFWVIDYILLPKTIPRHDRVLRMFPI